MTHEEAIDVVALIGAAYPDRKLPDLTIALYAKGLEPFPHDLSKGAVESFLVRRDSPFFPTIGEIRKVIEESGKARTKEEEALNGPGDPENSVNFYRITHGYNGKPITDPDERLQTLVRLWRDYYRHEPYNLPYIKDPDQGKPGCTWSIPQATIKKAIGKEKGKEETELETPKRDNNPEDDLPF